MSNVLTDGGFELHSPLWLYTNAVRSSAYAAYEGSFVAELTFVGPSAAAVSQRVVLTPGRLSAWSCRVRRVSGSGGVVFYALSDANAVLGLASIDGAAASGTWQVLSFFVAASEPGARLYVQSIDDGASVWLVDACEISEVAVPRHFHTAITALYDRIKTIAGADYYHDLTGRVYARALDPQTHSPGFPFACITLQRKPEFEPVDGTWVLATITPTVVGFVAESEALDGANSSVVSALKFIEDVTRAIMPASGTRWILGSSQIEDVSIDPQPMEVGMVDNHEYAIVPIDIMIRMRVQRSDLGPSAT
jgi:hypothetical protein